MQTGFMQDGQLSWLLRSPDFNTASDVAQAINGEYGPGMARARDAQRIDVTLPEQYVNDPVSFVAGAGVRTNS